MRRIVVSLLKGGVAKSVTAVHLAHGLALAGYRILLVDTDVQSQCSDMLGVRPERGLAEVINGWAEPFEALLKARDNLWLLAGGTALAGVKREISRRDLAPEAVLAETVRTYEGHFDVLILDTAPGWDALLVNALYCSREILSPVSMEPMALTGLLRFEERLEVLQKYNPDLKLKWVLPTFVDGRVKKSAEIMVQLDAHYGDRLAPPIKYSVKLSEGPAFGKTIFEHDPKGPGAEGYQQLVERVLRDAPPASVVRPMAARTEAPAVGPQEPAPPLAAAAEASLSLRGKTLESLKERLTLAQEPPTEAVQARAVPAPAVPSADSTGLRIKGRPYEKLRERLTKYGRT